MLMCLLPTTRRLVRAVSSWQGFMNFGSGMLFSIQDTLVVHLFIAVDHGADVCERRVAGGGEIDVDDEEDQHH